MIELGNFEWILLEDLFFPVLVLGIFFHENQHVCVFLDHIVIFLDFFELKKTRNVIWRRTVVRRAREVPLLTIWCNFG